jgi:hypothetical protein
MNENDFIDDFKKWTDDHKGWTTESVIGILYRRIRVLEEKIKYLEPTQEQMDKYPSLKDAFDAFIVIKKLTTECENNVR